MFLIEIGGERQFVESLDGYPEDVVVIAADIPAPSDRDSATTGLDVAGVEAFALSEIDRRADQMSDAQFSSLRRLAATVLLWNEVQRLKLANATGNFVGLTILEKAKQFPTLAALAQQSGNTIAAVATAVENRLWDRVQRIAVAEAKLLLGRDAVRAAATADAKIAAADAITWDE